MEQRPQSNIKFIHCRNIQRDGSTSPRGGMTIAYTMNKEGLVVGWASAKCHMRDNFNKAVGRMKAAGRMLSDRFYQDCPEIDEKTFISNCFDTYKKMDQAF